MIPVQHVAVSIKRRDGDMNVMRFITFGRGNFLPPGAEWFNSSYWTREPSPENLAAEINKTFENDPNPPVSWRIVDDSAIPEDRSYRGAWMDDGKVITHDMEKAKALHRDYLRNARKSELAELDAQWMKAMGAKDEVAADAVEAQRQALRDAPADPRIDAAKTTDELKLVELPSEEAITISAVRI